MSKMLSSWKEIAHYFGKGVRTVQRWEKALDLPIHRPQGAPSNVVLARTSDLEEWMHRGPGALEAKGDTVNSLDLTKLCSEVYLLADMTRTSVSEQQCHASQTEVDNLADILHRVNIQVSSGEHAAKAA